MSKATKLKRKRKIQAIVEENLKEIEDDIAYAQENLERYRQYRNENTVPHPLDSLEELEAYILDYEHFLETLKIFKEKYPHLKDGLNYALKDFARIRENYIEEDNLIHKYLM